MALEVKTLILNNIGHIIYVAVIIALLLVVMGLFGSSAGYKEAKQLLDERNAILEKENAELKKRNVVLIEQIKDLSVKNDELKLADEELRGKYEAIEREGSRRNEVRKASKYIRKGLKDSELGAAYDDSLRRASARQPR